MKTMITYFRVSTQKQGRSGLGLEAQREAVSQYVQHQNGQVIGSYSEVETGKSNARPELAKALSLAKATGALLVIAKLDRLSRNAAFLLALRDSGAKFVAADMPTANALTVGIMSLIAEQEREAISKRTTEALQAARARGQVLGNPNGAAALRRAGKGNKAAVMANAHKTAARVETMRPFIQELQEQGCKTLQSLAEALNARGFATARGGRWHQTTVRRLLARL